ncbi:MAG: 3-phosphoshikimate 1-carboxyvinyltransferase [Myxococcaceae bacterium]|nr:3-phosphoshikimate 1-carboxyvinyltransferase [Myxococcaceae bacterium]
MNLSKAPLKPARLWAPVSKSDAVRALLLSHVLELPVPAELSAPWATDVKAVHDGLSALRGAAADECIDLDCGDGAAPLRFLLAQAAVTPGARVRFWGSARLGERPHSGLREALLCATSARGLRINGGAGWPIEVFAPLAPAWVERFEVAGTETSQFVSALLFAAAAQVRRHGQPCEVAWRGTLASAGYALLTLQWLEQAGFVVQRLAQSVRLCAWSPVAQLPKVPADASALTYLWLLAWKSGGTVAARAWPAQHPDLLMETYLREAGLSVLRSENEMRVEGTARKGFHADAAQAPDAMLALAALACVLPEPSEMKNTSILRRKESDRVESIVSLVTAVGGRAEVQGETLRIFPATPPRAFRLDSRADHRLAMSGACLSVLAGVRAHITEPHCVRKSFPGFWEQLAATGWHVDANRAKE